MTFLVVGCPSANSFDSELWPGEGIPHFATKNNHLILYEQPSRTSRILSKQPVKKGGEIPYSETRFRTIHPGIVTTTTSGHLFGRPLGTTSYLSIEQYYAPEPVWQDLPYKANESFEYLQDRAEGTCFIRWKGMIVEIESCPWLGLSQAMDFDLLEEPVTEWWVRVTDDNNQPLGWLLIEEESVKFLPRTL